MMTPSRILARLITVVVLFASLATPVAAKDKEFGAIVSRLKAHYNAKSIPFMGFAGFIANRFHPEGVRGIKLAVLVDIDPSRHPEDVDFDDFMQRIVGSDLQPMVRVHSRRSGEQTYIYARDAGKYVEMLIVALEQNEATVVKVKVNPDTLDKWMDEPGEMKSRSMGD